MKVLATVNPEDAPAPAEFLKGKEIPYQTRTVTEANGLDVTGFLVDERGYERACGAVSWR